MNNQQQPQFYEPLYGTNNRSRNSNSRYRVHINQLDDMYAQYNHRPNRDTDAQYRSVTDISGG